MKKTSLVFLFIFAVLTGYSFQKESRNVNSFDEISLSTHADLYVKIGSEFSVELEGSDLDEIETVVDGGRLKIKNMKSMNWGWNSKIKVYVTMPKVNAIYTSGSGDIIGESTIVAEKFKVGISGSGDIRLDIEAEEIAARISGSGDMELSGKTKKFVSRISGSGTIDAEDMKSINAEIRISGSGNTSIEVSGDLEVRIAGSGNVYYSGNPKNINSHSGGSGKVRKRS